MSSLKAIASAVLFAAALSVQGQEAPVKTAFKFDFGPGKVQPGYTQVLPSTTYTADKGYGFDYASPVTAQNYPGKNPLRDDYVTSDKPYYFSVRLPEGNYNIKVLLGDRNGTSATTIKAECRRLMVEEVKTAKGAFALTEFTVHVRDSLIRTGGTPTGQVRLKANEGGYLHWDDKLTLEFNNSAPKLCALEISPAPAATTLFLAGNSTVVDQAREPWAAWGQMFPAFFLPGKVAIANYAESGETLKAFKGERRLEKIWSLAKAGDYLFIEFAHNDMKEGPNHLDPFTTYKATLKEWIGEARKRGVTPVLVSSMHRRTFDSTGQIRNSLLDYPEAVRQTAKEENVALVDLNAMSKTLYETWGPERSIRAFVHYPAHSFPGQTAALQDNTHFSTYGAYELAKLVVTGIRNANLPIAQYLKKDLPAYDPAQPAAFEDWKLPQSSFIAVQKPDGN
ncbi:rhamnogalacturonan acetylesterase [Paraflavisolibacter sp. H34]|uniref:rhamnogalacturonan acetylesterase n=1 Tax=Huijunlia imazamoxiresistens TaxID=3127457 RepID=UPI0030180EEB